MFFTNSDYSFLTGTGEELWKSNGTPDGTVLVKDIKTGNYNSSYPSNLTAVGNTLFFSASDGITGENVWKSDGSAISTTLVKNIIAGPGNSAPSNLTEIGSTLSSQRLTAPPAPNCGRAMAPPLARFSVKIFLKEPMEATHPVLPQWAVHCSSLPTTAMV